LIKFSEKVPHWALYKFSFFIFLGVFIGTFIIPEYIYHQVWIILAFFFFLTLAALVVIEKVSSKNSDNFLAIYFSVMLGRLFVSIIFAVVFILADREHIINFSFNFLFLYLLFLGFEIYGIITNLRHNFKKGTGDE